MAFFANSRPLQTGCVTNKQHKNANCLDAKCSDQNASHRQWHKLASETWEDEFAKEFWQLTHRENWAYTLHTLPYVVFKIVVLIIFVLLVLRDTGDELVRHCCLCCCCGIWTWCPLHTAIVIGWWFCSQCECSEKPQSEKLKVHFLAAWYSHSVWKYSCPISSSVFFVICFFPNYLHKKSTSQLYECLVLAWRGGPCMITQ